MEDQAVSEHQIDVIAGPEAAAVARTAVAGAGVRQLETRIDDVQLAISEVVTNAVRHGRLREGVDAVRVIVGVEGNSVRVTVEQPTTAAGVQIKEPRLEQDDPGGLGCASLIMYRTTGDTMQVRRGECGSSSTLTARGPGRSS